MEKEGKNCFNTKKIILTSEQCAEHPFTGKKNTVIVFVLTQGKGFKKRKEMTESEKPL